MKVTTMANGKTIHTWISVRKSLFRKWWLVEVRNHCVGAELPGIDVCIAKFGNEKDAERYAKEQRKKRGY